MLSSSSFSTVVKLKATPFSLFFNAILTQTKLEEEGSWVHKTQTKPEEEGSWVRREIKKMKKKQIEKLGLRVNVYFLVCVFLMGCVEK